MEKTAQFISATLIRYIKLLNHFFIIISSYTVSKLVHFSETQCTRWM